MVYNSNEQGYAVDDEIVILYFDRSVLQIFISCCNNYVQTLLIKLW